jgi:GxxExxY protein
MDTGPGLLETVYEILLAHELQQRGLKVERQVPIPITYKGIQFHVGFRADMLVEDKVVVELKAVTSTAKAHKKQVLTYLRLTGRKLGYLLNFGEALMKDGISRVLDGDIEDVESSVGSRDLQLESPKRKQ